MTTFVDSSAFYAAADDGERNHERAIEVLSGEQALLTTDHVLVETWLLLSGRLGFRAAERYWTSVREGATEVEPVVPADLETAWGIGEEFPDQRYSLIDRTSFAVMLRLGMHRAAAFDDDFAVFRFGPGRRRAFEVVR